VSTSPPTPAVTTTPGAAIAAPTDERKRRVRQVIQSASLPETPAATTCDTPVPPTGTADQRATAYNDHGLVCADEGRYEQARQDFDQAAVLAPTDATIRGNRGFVHFYLDNYPAALADLDFAISGDPAELLWMAARGLIRAAVGRCPEGIADLDGVVGQEAEEGWWWVARGLAYELCGDESAAAQDYQKAIDTSDEPDELATALVNLGQLYLRQDRYAEAISVFTQAIETEPSDAFAYIGRGAAHKALQQYQNALADFSQAIALEPDDPDGYELRGDAYYDDDHFQDALADYQAALQRTVYTAASDLARLHADLGWTYYALGNVASCYDELEQAIQLETQPYYYWSRGVLLGDEADYYLTALEDLSVALSLGAESLTPEQKVRAYQQRGQINVALADRPAALADFASALAIIDVEAAEHATTYNLRGLAYYDWEMYVEAEDDFTEAIALVPQSIFYYNRAGVYQVQANYQAAVDDYTAAIAAASEPDDPLVAAYQGRGLAYLDLEQLDLAIGDFSFVLDREPENGWVYYYRGVAYVRQELYNQARADLTEAQRLATDDLSLLEAVQKALAALP
ncbi:MAG: tetratricopeptide repeat protein, partial [Chloroflexota bacterium]